MRSQPEISNMPVKIDMIEYDFDNFGFAYKYNKESSCWKFEFEIQHPGVFENGIVPLGALYKDCEGVPMIICDGQLQDISPFLNVTDELRNIYFEVV